MRRDTSHHKQTASSQAWIPFAAIMLFIGIIAIGVIRVQSSYPQQWLQEKLISEPVSMRSFSQPSESTAQASAKNTLCLWIETSPSMAGYLSDPRDADYYQTFFEQLVRYPQQMLGGNVTATQIVRYAFNPGFALKLEKNQQRDVADLLRGQIVEDYENLLTVDSFYQDLTTDANALAAVFEALDPTCMNVIITDMIESKTAFSQALEKRYQAAFRDGLTMDIVGFEDIFSGFLFEVGEDGQTYAFGTGDKKGYNMVGGQAYYASDSVDRIRAKPISLGPYSTLPHPRPLYAIVIGTTAQCDALAETIMNLYDSYRDGVNHARGTLLRDKNGANMTPLAEPARRFQFHRRSLGRVPEKIAHSAVTPLDGNVRDTSDAIDYERRKLHANEADAVLFLKEPLQSAQTYTLTYSFKPDVENYETTVQSEDYRIDGLSLRRLAFSPYAGDGDGPRVHTLGDQYLTYQVVDCGSVSGVIADIASVTPEGITLQVTVDVSSMDTGYYRIDIPVVYGRNVGKLENTLDTAALAVWYCTADSFPSRGYNYCTPNLRTQLQMLCRAQEAHLNTDVRVATVSVDFEIALK